jgi:molybdopterin synthase sulfur carrier subunit
MIRVLFFASLREALGQAELNVAAQDMASVADIRHRLADLCPKWSDISSAQVILAAVNQEMSADDRPVCDGDEVAFFPRVTGG